MQVGVWTGVIAALLAASGVHAAEPRLRQALLVPFDQAAAQLQLQPGQASIRGSAMIPRNGGGVETCAGMPVRLIPASATAREWAEALYGSADGGFRAVSARLIEFVDADRFEAVARQGVCDAAGVFRFDRVRDGVYYLQAEIYWSTGATVYGGSILKVVEVNGGANAEAVLAP